MTGWFTISQSLKLFVPQDSHSYNTLHTSDSQITCLETETGINQTNTEALKMYVLLPNSSSNSLLARQRKQTRQGLALMAADLPV